MTEPQYVSIAGEIAQKIRSGALPVGTQLPSYTELAKTHGVSEIVIRSVRDLLVRQGLVRTVQRRGMFVADQPKLVRIAPERQWEDPEVTFGNESAGGREAVTIQREEYRLPADDERASLLRVDVGTEVIHTVVKATVEERPVSISDSYQPSDAPAVSTAEILEETVTDRSAEPAHAEWLRIGANDLIKAVHQRFLMSDGRVLMVSDVSYPNDRYGSFVFRMALDPQE